MTLKDLHIDKEYRNLKCDVINEFYIPVLSTAVKYKRAVGFFNSAALYEIAIGLKNLVSNKGKMELIVSPRLTEEDIKSIQLGYEKRQQIIEKALLRDFSEPRNKIEISKLNLLANLIADNTLDIKVAFKLDAHSAGIFHEKIGIVIDSDGNKIAFTGSMNETYSGLLQNYESIDVFCSWREEDSERVVIKEYAFDNLWDNLDVAMEVIPFPKVAIERLNKYKLKTTETLFESQDVDAKPRRASNFFSIPDTINLHDYQKKAICTWIEKGSRGIFDMATGTGKTYTALGALSKLSDINPKLAVVIVCPYQHLVEQWVEDIEAFNTNPIIAYSSYKKWRELFKDSVNAFNIGVKNKFCIITTNSTFATPDFQKILQKIKGPLCFVVDEAHNFGASNLSTLLPNNAKFRLALSATIERYRDDVGTKKLLEYFGEKCIELPLSKAIQMGCLTSYYYYPIPVYLDDDEFDKYKSLTKSISKLGGASEENCKKNPTIELLLLKRARIIAGAKQKVDKLLKIIEPYKHDDHMLVYCGATKYDRTDISDEEDIKQIDYICLKLNELYGFKLRKFTSSESKEERIEIKNSFIDGSALQLIAAIKCLDEGVNIPAIKRAFILASSTNPKEYIQRRGRVLRKSEGKDFAEIFDFITLPRKISNVEFCSMEDRKIDLSLIKKELTRMMDFANTARNPLSIDSLKEEILNAYGVYNIDIEEEYDD